MLILNINKNLQQPIYSQIINEIIRLIDNKTLPVGYRLPSTRQLAEKIGINRSTVVRAYEELWSLGYIESTKGSYTYVRKRKESSVGIEDFHEEGLASEFLDKILSIDTLKPNSFSQIFASDQSNNINFQKLEPDTKLIDRKAIARCFREIINDEKISPFEYCHPRGYELLRKSILQHMQLHAINAKDKNILITNGTQNSLHLIFQSIVKKGDAIAVESPTYSMIMPLIKSLAIKNIEIPIKSDGMDLDYLEKVLSNNSVRLIYTMPTFHNPTGITMAPQKREKLLQICEENNILIVEDSFEEEMKFFGKVHLPIKSMDSKGLVIYLSSFSKILTPGLRIGWIIGHNKIIDQLTKLKTSLDLSSNTLSQILLHHFCKSGGYELHIRRVMKVFRSRLKTALKALKHHIPNEKATWVEPLGGFLIWLKINSKKKGFDYVEHFKKHGVLVSDGQLFFFTPTKDNFIRISISKCSEVEIEEGIRRIGEALKEIS